MCPAQGSVTKDTLKANPFFSAGLGMAFVAILRICQSGKLKNESFWFYSNLLDKK